MTMKAGYIRPFLYIFKVSVNFLPFLDEKIPKIGYCFNIIELLISTVDLVPLRGFFKL